MNCVHPRTPASLVTLCPMCRKYAYMLGAISKWCPMEEEEGMGEERGVNVMCEWEVECEKKG